MIYLTEKSWNEKANLPKGRGPPVNHFWDTPGRDSVVSLGDFTGRGKVTGLEEKTRMTAGLPKPIIKIAEKFSINLLTELLFRKEQFGFLLNLWRLTNLFKML